MANSQKSTAQLISEMPPALKNGMVKRVQWRTRGIAQAYELRDLSAELALNLRFDKDLDLNSKAETLHKLVNVWDTCCERIRVFNGKPLPGSLRPTGQPKKRRLLEKFPAHTTTPTPTPAQQ